MNGNHFMNCNNIVIIGKYRGRKLYDLNIIDAQYVQWIGKTTNSRRERDECARYSDNGISISSSKQLSLF